MTTMTEEEAKTKWCPYAGVQRMERQNEYCLGSGCMAWRRPLGAAYSTSSRGYCGLAGKPE